MRLARVEHEGARRSAGRSPVRPVGASCWHLRRTGGGLGTNEVGGDASSSSAARTFDCCCTPRALNVRKRRPPKGSRMTSESHQAGSCTIVVTMLAQPFCRVDSISIDWSLALSCRKALSGAGGACGLVAISGAVWGGGSRLIAPGACRGTCATDQWRSWAEVHRNVDRCRI